MRLSAKLPVDIKCPECGRLTSKPLASLKANTEIRCECGACFRITGDGFQKASKTLDDFQKSMSVTNRRHRALRR